MANLYLDRSEYILRRQILLQNLEAPLISDAKKNFGNDFADLMFCKCPTCFKEDFGLEPGLKGCIGKDLWSSPSDVLIGKVCLKPPLTSKHVKALTHQGIMDIGVKIEKLFWNQVEIEKNKEMEEQDRTLRLLCESSKKDSIDEVKSKMIEEFAKQRLGLIDEMEALCKEEIRRIQERSELDLQDELDVQARRMEQQYQVKVVEQEAKTHDEITIHSAINMDEVENSMQKVFQCQLQKREIQSRFEIQKEQTSCREKLKTLRHELECKNLANMMYVICMERKKCTVEKEMIQDTLHHEICELSSQVRDKDAKIAKLTAERDKHITEVKARESALLAVIKEFQKFINFALKSVPKQAEYLLCAEKLMVFDLADALSKVEDNKDTDDDHDRNFLWNRTPAHSDSTLESVKIKDGHDCLKEDERSDSELSMDQFLPGFYYNEQLFVREDFRNMVSQGVTINENNMLWTKHVQDVTDVLQNPCQSCAFNEEKEADKKSNKSNTLERKKSIISYQSSVHFSLKEKIKPSTESMDREKKFRRASLKPVEVEAILQTIDFSHIGSEENRKTLISAKNSVELLKESITKRKSSIRSAELEKFNRYMRERENQNADHLSEEEVSEGFITNSKLIEDARDSLIKTKVDHVLASSTDMKILKKEDEIPTPKRNNSKLMMTSDSLEVLRRRESLQSEGQRSHKEKDNACVTTACELVHPDLSYEEIGPDVSVENETGDDYDKMERARETPRRISIAFVGKSIIYGRDGEKEASENEIVGRKQKGRKPLPRKQKKTRKGKLPDKPSEFTIRSQKSDQGKPAKKVVMGDSTYRFLDQDDKQFATDRVHSFLNIIKEHPNLIRMFTSVTR